MTPGSSAFWGKIDRRGRECWPWTGRFVPSGYGSFGFRGRTFSAHRVVYELLVGPVPVGLELDHLCRNRACCNPDHLEPVTHRENVLRGVSVPAQNALKTHCKRGHEFNEENTGYVQRERYEPQRFCRACRSEARRHWPSTPRPRRLGAAEADGT